MVAMEAGKRHFFSHLSISCKEEKMLDQKHECYRFEPALKKNWGQHQNEVFI